MNFNNQKINSEIAEILGAFIGDGWIESRGSATYICGNQIEDKDYYDKFLAPLFSKHFISVKPKKFPYWNVYGIVSYNRTIIKKALNLGFQKGKKCYIAEIPNLIMNSNNKKIVKAVLRGIFDADGSFWCEKSNAKTSTKWKRKHHYHPGFVIASCSKKLIEQVKILLDKFNIYSQIKLKKAGFRNNRNYNNTYLLQIRRINEIKKWFEIIGSNNPRHLTRYFVWKKFGFLPPYTNINERKDMLNGKIDPYVHYR